MTRTRHAPSRGRGRPSLFTEDRQTAYLDLVAAGVRLGLAAEKIGIDRRRITYAAHTQPEFARRLAAARAKGRAVRANPATWDHGNPSTYNNLECRCTPCTRAATKARAAGRQRNRHNKTHTPPDSTGGTLHHLPPRPHPPIARAS